MHNEFLAGPAGGLVLLIRRITVDPSQTRLAGILQDYSLGSCPERAIGVVRTSFLTGVVCLHTMPVVMATSTRKPRSQIIARKLAAEKAEEVARVLHSFAGSLKALDASSPETRKSAVTPRNWWRVQAGRFKDDPTFSEFVAQVQAARRAEG